MVWCRAVLVRLKSLVFIPLTFQPVFAQGLNLVSNPGFEQVTGSIPNDWQQDPTAVGLGTVQLSSVNAHSGRYSLELVPNASNAPSDRSGSILGVGQAIPAQDLSGQQLYVAGWMNADIGANAVVRVYAFFQDGTTRFQEIRQGPSPSGPVLRRDVFIVPNEPQLAFLLIGCLAEGTSGAAYFDDLNLSVGVPASWLEANGTWNPGPALSASISVNAASPVRAIPPTLFGSNLEWPWDGDGVWDTTTNGINPSIYSLTLGMGVVLHRFPGGVFSDFYSWQNGVGPQSTRPAVAIYPGGPVEANTFGTDEALAFAAQTGGQLLITVNVVTGSPDDAANWVRYVNGSGRRVTYWEIGNESYDGDTTGLAELSSLTPQTYAARLLQFALAMRQADPGIKIGAILDENYPRTVGRAFPDWTEQVLAAAGSQIDFVAVHLGYAPVITQDLGWNPRTVYSAMLAAPTLIGDQLADLTTRMNALVPGRTAPIQIAVTEWGPLFQDSMTGQYTDHTKTLGSALFAASAMKRFLESPQTDVANLFKLVDTGFMGWLGMRQGSYAAKATALAMQMFTAHFGTILVNTSAIVPVYDSPYVGWVDAVGSVPYLETVSSTSPDGKQLYLMVINKHFDRVIQASISVAGFSPAANGTAFTLTGAGLDSNTATQPVITSGPLLVSQAQIEPNPQFYEGTADGVTISSSGVTGISQNFTYAFPPHSITSLVLPAAQ